MKIILHKDLFARHLLTILTILLILNPLLNCNIHKLRIYITHRLYYRQY